MDKQLFSKLVLEAVNALPDEFADRLENVDVIVEDQPDEKQLKKVPERSLLLGLYEGIPQTKRGSSYGMVLPDKITIFQKPIEQKCRTDEDIVRQVGETVRHEIAHHFGISDDQLRLFERERRNKLAKENSIT